MRTAARRPPRADVRARKKGDRLGVLPCGKAWFGDKFLKLPDALAGLVSRPPPSAAEPTALGHLNRMSKKSTSCQLHDKNVASEVRRRALEGQKLCNRQQDNPAAGKSWHRSWSLHRAVKRAERVASLALGWSSERHYVVELTVRRLGNQTHGKSGCCVSEIR